MAFEVEASIDINRPLDEVFEAFCDISALTEWVKSVDEVRNYSGDPVGVGSTWIQVIKFMGKEFEGEVEVTEFEPGQRVAQNFNGVVSGQMAAEFEDLGDAARVHMYFHVEPGGFFGSIAAPLMKSNMNKDVNNDLQRFKALLEG